MIPHGSSRDDVRRMDPPRSIISITEEEATTAPMLLRIGVFAAIAFLAAAGLIGEGGRGVPLTIGGGIVTALVLFAGWLQFQSR